MNKSRKSRQPVIQTFYETELGLCEVIDFCKKKQPQMEYEHNSLLEPIQLTGPSGIITLKREDCNLCNENPVI